MTSVSNSKTVIVDFAEVPVTSLVLLQDGLSGRIMRTFNVDLEAGSNSLLIAGLSNNTVPDSITLTVRSGGTTSDLSDDNAIFSHISQFGIFPNGGAAAPQPDPIKPAPSTGASGFINAIVEFRRSDEVQVEVSYVAHPIVYVPEYKIHKTMDDSEGGGNTPSAYSGLFPLRYWVNIFQFTGETWKNLVITQLGQASSVTQVQSMPRPGQQEIPLRRRDVILGDQAFSEAEAIIGHCLHYLKRFYHWKKPIKVEFSSLISVGPSTAEVEPEDFNSTEDNSERFAAPPQGFTHPQSPQILHSLPERHQSILSTTIERQQGDQTGPAVIASRMGRHGESEPVMRRQPPPSTPITPNFLGYRPRYDDSLPQYSVRFDHRKAQMQLDLIELSGASNIIPAEIDLNTLESRAPQVAVKVIYHLKPFRSLADKKATDPECNNVAAHTTTELEIRNTGPYDILPGTLEIVLRGRDIHIRDWYTSSGGAVRGRFFDLAFPESMPEAIRAKVTSTGSIVAKSTRTPPSPTSFLPTPTKSSLPSLGLSPFEAVPTFHTFWRTYTWRTRFTNPSPFPASFEFVQDGTAVFNALVHDLIHSGSSDASLAPSSSTPCSQRSHSSPSTPSSCSCGTPSIPFVDLPPFNVDLLSQTNADNGLLDFALEEPYEAFEDPGEGAIQAPPAVERDGNNKGSDSQHRTVKVAGLWQLEKTPRHLEEWRSIDFWRRKLQLDHPLPPSPWGRSRLLRTPEKKAERASHVEVLALDWLFSPLKSPRLVWRVELGPARIPSNGEDPVEETVEVVSVWKLTARVNSVVFSTSG